jgi:hypothetical protein
MGNDETIDFMQQRCINFKLQNQLITSLLRLLPALLHGLDTEIEVYTLINTMEGTLNID